MASENLPPPIPHVDPGSGRFSTKDHVPRLWNPNTAGILSVLLTGAVFGPIIHGLNWRSIGCNRDARTSFIWAGSIFVFVLVIVLATDNPNFFLINAVPLLAWHFVHGKKQIAFTKSLPAGYEKKPILIPAVIGIFGVLLFAGFMAVASFALDLVTGSEEDATEHFEDAPTTREDGSPSDQTVRHAAWTMNSNHINESFKRGQVLEALGGGGVPVGTALYPIKLDGFPQPIYLSRDEFDEWRFTIGDNPRLIPVRTPPPPETAVERKLREKKEAENAKASIAAAEQARKAAVEAQKKAEEEKRRQNEEIARRNGKEREQRQTEELRKEREGKEAAERTRLETYEQLRLAGERQRQEAEERERKIAEEMARTKEQLRLAGEGQRRKTEGMDGNPGDQPAKEPEKLSPPENPRDPEKPDSPDKPQGDQVAVRLAEAKAELATLEITVAGERQRWATATDTINRLTNFKKTPVKEGSAAYHQCMDASRVIQEVEQKASLMKADKARLEALIKELSPVK